MMVHMMVGAIYWFVAPHDSIMQANPSLLTPLPLLNLLSFLGKNI
jgi:hypothetical protein